MNSVICELVNYLNSKNKNPPAYFDGALEALFIWLTMQLRLKHTRPYKLNPLNPHHQELKKLIEEWKGLSNLFEVKKDKLNFKSSITDIEQNEIRHYIRDHLKPFFFMNYW